MIVVRKCLPLAAAMGRSASAHEGKAELAVSSKPGRVLSRRYALIATASIVPLFLVILLLAWFQFQNQHDQLVEDLENEVIKHGTLLGNVIGSVRDHIRSMEAWAAIYHDDPALSAEATLDQEGAAAGEASSPLADRAVAWLPNDSRFFFKGGDAGLEARADLGTAEGLVQHMRLAHRAMPYLRWSYYFAGGERFFSIYPVNQPRAFGGVLRDAEEDAIVDRMFAQPIIDRPPSATPRPKAPYWTEAFLDPAGAGWMVAQAAEVPFNDGSKGIVATAVLLDFLTGFVRAFDYPTGRIWLVNEQGQILAASDGRRLTGLRLLTLEDVLPDLVAAAGIEDVLAPARQFRTLGDVNLLSRPIAAAPWHLLYVIEPGEVTGLILPRFVPYGVILIGLLFTFFIAQFLRQRLIIGPALALADYVKAESQEQPQPAPDLPEMWRPWIATVSEAFAAKRKANQQIQESEAYFRAMAEAHPVPVSIIEMESGRVLHASRTFADLFRMPLEALVDSDVRYLYVNPEERTGNIELLRQRDKVLTFEQHLKRGDGSTFLASTSARRMVFGGTEAVISGIVDLTNIKEAEAEIERQRQALEASEQRFRTIAEGHPVPLAIVRRMDQKLVYASPPLAAFLGLSLAELYQVDLRNFYAEPEDRRRLAEMLNAEQHVEQMEIDVRRPDGRVVTAAVTCKLMDYQGEEALVTSIVDLTDKKRAEAEIARQRQALHQAEKLNALGSLLANVAHELNNPLSVVVGYATMQLDLSSDPAARARAEKIHAAAERCARIVRTFLAMAREKKAVRRRVQLDEVIEAALEIAGYGLRTADIDLDLQLCDDLPDLFGDGDQLTLVFMNLIVNAQHALQDRQGPKNVRISTGRDEAGVWIEFADTGDGIDGKLVRRIFEPFFTTKPQGVGTGIGLSVCHTLVVAHGGDITVGSTLQGGALFRVGLPILEADQPVDIVWDQEQGRTHRQGQILVVEDEPAIAEMVAEMLARDGHDVTVAHSGRAALKKIELAKPDLVISDVRMPGLGGPELHRILAERHPQIAGRMVFMTGDTLASGLGDFFERTDLPLLEKPLEPAILHAEVQAMLGGDPGKQRAARGRRSPLD